MYILEERSAKLGFLSNFVHDLCGTEGSPHQHDDGFFLPGVSVSPGVQRVDHLVEVLLRQPAVYRKFHLYSLFLLGTETPSIITRSSLTTIPPCLGGPGFFMFIRTYMIPSPTSH